MSAYSLDVQTSASVVDIAIPDDERAGDAARVAEFVASAIADEGVGYVIVSLGGWVIATNRVHTGDEAVALVRSWVWQR